MDGLPEAVREMYRAEIERLEKQLEKATSEDVDKIRAAIADLEAELVVEDWPFED